VARVEGQTIESAAHAFGDARDALGETAREVPAELTDQVAEHDHPQRGRIAERLEARAKHREIECQRPERADQHARRALM
jgi:hypothetical protein